MADELLLLLFLFDDEYPVYNRVHLPRVHPLDSKQ